MLRRNIARPSAPDAATLQYANGKSMARLTPGAGRFVPLVGFHVEAGKDAELDKAMQAALGLGALIEIKHQRPGGAEIIRHWHLGDTVNFYPLTSGPVATSIAASVSERHAQATADAGIGLRWGSQERSKMALRGYLDVLVAVGYVWQFQLAVRSRMTDVLLSALLDHGRVCEAADQLIDRVRHPEVVFFHEIAMPLGAGSEEETWGKGETASVLPFRSLHPADVDAEYLRTVWRPDSVHATALRDWERMAGWAAEYAAASEEAPAPALASEERSR